MTSTRYDPNDPVWREKGVTVCLVTYNHAAYVRQALDGIVQQTHPYVKIVACDDGSTDGTYEILKEYEMRLNGRMLVLTHPGHANQGAYHTYGVCLEHVDTPYFVGHASDDFWEPDAVEYWLDCMARQPETDVLYGPSRVVDESGQSLYRFHGTEEKGTISEIMEASFERTPAHEPTMFYRANCVGVLRQEPDLAYGDLFHNILLFKTKRIRYCPRPVVNYRWHLASSWQAVPREKLAERRLAVLERFHLRKVMADEIRAQTILLVSLLAAYANMGNTVKLADIRREIREHVARNPNLLNMPELWAKGIQLSSPYNPHAHAVVLSLLPWALAHGAVGWMRGGQICGQIVSWRETAAPRALIKVLVLLATGGCTLLVFRNMRRALWRWALGERGE